MGYVIPQVWSTVVGQSVGRANMRFKHKLLSYSLWLLILYCMNTILSLSSLTWVRDQDFQCKANDLSLLELLSHLLLKKNKEHVWCIRYQKEECIRCHSLIIAIIITDVCVYVHLNVCMLCIRNALSRELSVLRWGSPCPEWKTDWALRMEK